jgi:xanthine dehydrogenase accessory factor
VAFAGSRKKVAFLTKKLEDKGVPPEQLAALHAPTGLDLGR